MGTPNGLREPVWCDLTGIGGGEEGFVWARGVEAGRAGGVNVDVRAGIVVEGMFGEAG